MPGWLVVGSSRSQQQRSAPPKDVYLPPSRNLASNASSAVTRKGLDEENHLNRCRFLPAIAVFFLQSVKMCPPRRKESTFALNCC